MRRVRDPIDISCPACGKHYHGYDADPCPSCAGREPTPLVSDVPPELRGRAYRCGKCGARGHNARTCGLTDEQRREKRGQLNRGPRKGPRLP